MSENLTPAEAEATRETVTFEHFGREWSVPSQVRLSHMRALRADPSNIGIVDTFLTADDLAALDEINPTGDDLDKFTDALVAAQGLKNSGNS